jgi:hypothetical protein
VKLGFAFLACLALGCGGSTDNDPSGSGGSSGTGAISGSGGASTGGSPGTGAVSGTGGASTGGVTGIGPECTSDAECTLFSDCCTCEAYGPNETPPPSCLAACDKSACDANGASAETVQCVAGRCVAGFQCKPIQVICNAIPPKCGPGEVPAVLGDCWGGCVPVTQCASAPSCNECNGTLMTCVQIDSSGGDGVSAHCVDVPKGCEGNQTCECMGTNVCTSPTSDCFDLSGLKGMACSCNACD